MKNCEKEFIRDITKVGSIPKSEARRRLNEIILEAKQEERERILKALPEG